MDGRLPVAASSRVAVELDGRQHERPHQADSDDDRDLWLRRHGYVTRRYGKRQIDAAARRRHRRPPRRPRLGRGRRAAQAVVGLGQAADALVDLLGRDAGVGQAQRVAPALEQEVRALDEGHAALAGGGEELVDVGALGQLDPHEVAALGRDEARVGQVALQRRRPARRRAP